MRSLHTYPTLATALATFAKATRSAVAQQVLVAKSATDSQSAVGDRFPSRCSSQNLLQPLALVTVQRSHAKPSRCAFLADSTWLPVDLLGPQRDQTHASSSPTDACSQLVFTPHDKLHYIFTLCSLHFAWATVDECCMQPEVAADAVAAAQAAELLPPAKRQRAAPARRPPASPAPQGQQLRSWSNIHLSNHSLPETSSVELVHNCFCVRKALVRGLLV